MEALDRAFENVCELDLVFHFDDVRHLAIHINIIRTYLKKLESWIGASYSL